MKISFFLSLVLLVACGQQTGSDALSEKKTDSLHQPSNDQAKLDAAREHACILDDSVRLSWVASGRFKPFLEIVCDTMPQVKEIVWGSKKTFDKKTTAQEILQVLFPGRIYAGVNDDGDTTQMDLWNCSRCPKDSVQYFDMTDMYTVFPSDGLNNTMIDTVMEQEHRGIKYQFISFYHMAEFSPMGSGRFSGAPMGMTIVKENNLNKEVIAFDPFLGSYGSFQNPVLPRMDWVGDHLFLSYQFSNGGPGDPYTSYREIFMLDEGKLKLAGTYHFLDFFNSVAAEWYAKTAFISGNEFRLTISGVISPGMLMENYPWAIESAYDELKQWVEQHRGDLGCYAFTLTVHQRLVNGKFKNSGSPELKIELCK